MMRIKTLIVALLLCVTPTLAWAQNETTVVPSRVLVTGSTGTGEGYNAAITGKPSGGFAPIGVLGIANRMGAAGVVGRAEGDGVGVYAVSTYAAGPALVASNLAAGGTALYVQSGGIKIPRTPRNYLRVYNPDTGALIGEFEFEFVQE